MSVILVKTGATRVGLDMYLQMTTVTARIVVTSRMMPGTVMAATKAEDRVSDMVVGGEGALKMVESCPSLVEGRTVGGGVSSGGVLGSIRK